MKISLLTYNMHKGKSFWFRSYQIAAMRELISALSPDLLFLQEIPGVHPRHFDQLVDPLTYFSHGCGSHYCYGKNAIYKRGHHGNAIVSKFGLKRHQNINISQLRLATRGLLHAEIELSSQITLHALNAHLDLLEGARQRQARFIVDYIRTEIPPDAPVILAGDFNDWRQRLDSIFERVLQRVQCHGQRLNTSPSLFPMYDLDRFYCRNVEVTELRTLHTAEWIKLSDHLPLLANAEFS